MNEIFMNINLNEVFAWVVRASLYSVAAIAIIVPAQMLMRRALSAKWSYALWIILLLRLAIPSGPESAWSLWNLAPQKLSQQQASSDFVSSESAVYYTAANTPDTSVSSQRTLKTYIPVIWLAGALLLMCGIIIGNLRLWNAVRRLPFVTDHALLELFEECRRSMRVHAMVGLVVTDRVKSPILFGFIRPRVLLPADLVRELPIERLRYILLHELAHLKRRDIPVGWVLAFLQSLHWFNPLVWWAFGRMRFDRELACDEKVLAYVPDGERRDYGDVLIGMLERFNHIHRLPAIAGILENKDQLKRRLVMIKKFRRPVSREIIMFTALLAALSIALLTEPQSLISQSSAQSGSIRVYTGGDAQNETDDLQLPEFIITVGFVDTPLAGFFKVMAEAGGVNIVVNPAIEGNVTINDTLPWNQILDIVLANHGLKKIVEGDLIRIVRKEIVSDDSSMFVHIKNPEVLERPTPDYTKEAREARIEGVVVLSVIIRDDGTVDNIVVNKGLGYGLDESAIETVATRWRFSPATRDGVPIDHPAKIEISFSLV
jgi:TonB family protein